MKAAEGGRRRRAVRRVDPYDLAGQVESIYKEARKAGMQSPGCLQIAASVLRNQADALHQLIEAARFVLGARGSGSRALDAAYEALASASWNAKEASSAVTEATAAAAAQGER